MSSRIRGLCAVLAAGLAAVLAVRREQRLKRVERELTAERAGSRLVDHVVHADQQVVTEGLERRLSNLAAAVAVLSDPAPEPSPSAHRPNPKEGGHQ